MAKGIKTGGRRPGSVNKATKEFRDTVRALLESNAENVSTWLAQVADGHGETKPAPDKALDLLAKLAEFAAPKLSRSEVNANITHRTLDQELTALNAQRNAEGNSPLA